MWGHCNVCTRTKPLTCAAKIAAHRKSASHNRAVAASGSGHTQDPSVGATDNAPGPPQTHGVTTGLPPRHNEIFLRSRGSIHRFCHDLVNKAVLGYQHIPGSAVTISQAGVSLHLQMAKLCFGMTKNQRDDLGLILTRLRPLLCTPVTWATSHTQREQGAMLPPSSGEELDQTYMRARDAIMNNLPHPVPRFLCCCPRSPDTNEPSCGRKCRDSCSYIPVSDMLRHVSAMSYILPRRAAASPEVVVEPMGNLATPYPNLQSSGRPTRQQQTMPETEVCADSPSSMWFAGMMTQRSITQNPIAHQPTLKL